MNDERTISRRALLGGVVLAGLGRQRALAQGYAGLDNGALGFAQVVAGKRFAFPADHGAHPEFRIEWWYVTANLVDADGQAFGAQWTLFRQASRPGPPDEGWASQQFWMGHAAVTRADTHRFSERFARGGVGQAGVEAEPFDAFIDAWDMHGLDGLQADRLAPLQMSAASSDFSFTLRLDADRPVVLQGDAGYSQKSAQGGQASYYYSQPFFKAKGQLTIDDKPSDVHGLAWLDREWSSAPLAAGQTGWDWFALHFDSGEKMMLYRLRQKDGPPYTPGNWILPDGQNHQVAPADIAITPQRMAEVAGRSLPVQWQIEIARLGVKITCEALNPNSWMGTSFPYWEGPIRFHGSHSGLGYLEMTGY